MQELRRDVFKPLLLSVVTALLAVVSQSFASPASAHLPGVEAVSAGDRSTCALTSAGGVKCWGDNSSGQLGNGQFGGNLPGHDEIVNPVDVLGLDSGVAAISVGSGYACAVTAAGGLKCWGQGYGLTPTYVAGLAAGVSGVSAGADHACVVMSSGGAKCWGQNHLGQLGDGTTTFRASPIDVAGLSSGVSDITSGWGHTCALTIVGRVKCWGDNSAGQLGDGQGCGSTCPNAVDVAGLASGVSSVSAGSSFTCALIGRSVKCWGVNYNGQLGDGQACGVAYCSTPVSVSGIQNASEITAGFSHACALMAASNVLCWGPNDLGQLGDGTTIGSPGPVAVYGLTAGVTAVSAGDQHTCAVMSSGGVKCWGLSSLGQLGGDPMRVPSPTGVPNLASGVASIAPGPASMGRTCFVTTSGGVKCLTGADSSPAVFAGLTSGVSSVAVGQSHACLLTTSGGVQCWGSNGAGQLGDGTHTGSHNTPVGVLGLSSDVAAIAVGAGHSCALMTVGAVKCWGDNTYGKLGIGTNVGPETCPGFDPFSCSTTPVDVTGMANDAVAISVGANHACVLTNTDAIRCWGMNYFGQLGDGSSTDRYSPVGVTGLASEISQVSVGGHHSCALTVAGAVMCWGFNAGGELGDGTQVARLTPGGVTGLSAGIAALSMGANHSCAKEISGGVACWGENYDGQLGYGSILGPDMCGPRNPCAKTPIDVVGLENGVAGLTLNGDHSCIVNNAGGVECWGGGVLGLGTTYSIVPLDVGVEAKPPPTPTPIPTATPDAVGGVAFDPPAHSDSSPWLVALPLAAFAFGAGAFAYRRAR